MNADNNKQELKLDITPDVSRGTYSNLAIISHGPTEIVLDFAQMLPGQANAPVRERIIMHPAHAKRLLNALADNIQKYEQNFGVIKDPVAKQNNSTVPYDILGKS